MQDSNLENGIVFLSLEPSFGIMESQLGPLDERLYDLEKRLEICGHWQPPGVPLKSPEYFIIDISDLNSAIELLEDIHRHSSPSKSLSPQPGFSKYDWKWDPVWNEFFAENKKQTLYLSRWHLDEQRQVWEHVSMNGMNLAPESATELLGSWEDWDWDPLWNEWHLDVSDGNGRTCVFASRWRVQAGGEWTYVGRVGNPEI